MFHRLEELPAHTLDARVDILGRPVAHGNRRQNGNVHRTRTRHGGIAWPQYVSSHIGGNRHGRQRLAVDIGFTVEQRGKLIDGTDGVDYGVAHLDQDGHPASIQAIDQHRLPQRSRAIERSDHLDLHDVGQSLQGAGAVTNRRW